MTKTAFSIDYEGHELGVNMFMNFMKVYEDAVKVYEGLEYSLTNIRIRIINSHIPHTLLRIFSLFPDRL